MTIYYILATLGALAFLWHLGSILTVSETVTLLLFLAGIFSMVKIVGIKQ